MNSVPSKITIGALLIFHLVVIVYAGYFLSPEFTLYPYLSAHNFIPYINIIDQHLPIIFFGPLSLPYWLVSSRLILLAFFYFLTLVTDIALFAYLKKSSSTHPYLYLSVYILIQILIAGGNTLWLDSFINLFILLYLYSATSPKKLFALLAGVFIAVPIIIKPTISLAFLPLIYYTKPKRFIYTFLGFSLVPLFILFYLISANILDNFFSLVINFNSRNYTALAIKYIPTKQALVLGLISLFSLIASIISKKKTLFLASIFSLLLIYPRYDPVHLQPWILLSVLSISQIKIKPILAITLITLLILPVLIKSSRYHYGDFYLTPSLRQLSSYIRNTPQDTVYVLGGSDLLYPFSNKLPPSGIYIPSLPWYLSNSEYMDKQLTALKLDNQALVVLNSTAAVDGQSLSSYAQVLLEYITQNYEKIKTIDNYRIYKRIQ